MSVCTTCRALLPFSELSSVGIMELTPSWVNRLGCRTTKHRPLRHLVTRMWHELIVCFAMNMTSVPSDCNGGHWFAWSRWHPMKQPWLRSYSGTQLNVRFPPCHLRSAGTDRSRVGKLRCATAGYRCSRQSWRRFRVSMVTAADSHDHNYVQLSVHSPQCHKRITV
jgi:hypothetical protein